MLSGTPTLPTSSLMGSLDASVGKVLILLLGGSLTDHAAF